MAIPAPTLQNLAGAIYLMTPESGMIIDGFDYDANCTMDFVYDASVGYDVGFVASNYKMTGSVKGKITSTTTGLGAAIPGAAYTLGNATSLNGITSGGVYIPSVSGSHSEKQLREITANFVKSPGIA